MGLFATATTSIGVPVIAQTQAVAATDTDPAPTTPTAALETYAKRTRLALPEGSPFASLGYLGAWKWPSVLIVTVVPAVAFLFW